MTLNLAREDLRVIMQEAMQAGESKAMERKPLARSGGDLDENGEIFAVSVKICDFWTEDPQSWFDRADNQFRIRGIKEDETKFSHCVQALNYSQHKEVKALIRDPPKGESYPALKKALVAAFGKTQLDRDTELLNLKHMGDRDPRSVAREIDSLMAEPGSLPRAVMINMLPQDVRVALATVDGLDDHHKIAEKAYKIMNMKKDRNTISAISAEEHQEVDAVGFKGRGPQKPQPRQEDKAGKSFIFLTRSSALKRTRASQVACSRLCHWRNVARETDPPAARAGRHRKIIHTFTSITHFPSISPSLGQLGQRQREQEYVHGMG